MALTPDQIAKLQEMSAMQGQQPQGAIQQAQEAPTAPQRDVGAPLAPDQKSQMHKAIMEKMSALPPESQKIFVAKLKELAQKQQKKK